MSLIDQAKISRRQINLETVVYSAEQEVTVPVNIKIPEGTQYLLQPILMLPKDKLLALPGPGKVRVQGLLAGILSYVDSSEQVHTLAMPGQEFFASFSLNDPGLAVRYDVDVKVDGAEVDRGEGSVANITVYLVIRLQVLRTETVEFVTGVSDSSVQTKTSSIRLQEIIKTAAIRQAIVLQLPLLPGATPAGVELCMANLNWQVEMGKLTAGGLVLAKAYCLGADGSVDVAIGQEDFSLELDFGSPEATESSLSYSFESIKQTIEAEGAGLEISLTLLLNATGYKDQIAEYVTGLSGADSQLVTVRLHNRIGEGEFKLALEGDCPLSDMAHTLEPVLPKVRVIEAQALENKVLVRGLLTLYAYYLDETKQRRVIVQEEEFSQFFDLVGCARGNTVNAWAWAEAVECRDGRYRVATLMRVEASEEQEVTVVSDVHVVDPNQAPVNASIILYTVKKGDSLFSVARRFNTTQELLWEWNNLSEQDGLELGQKLLIPVYQTKV